MKSILLDAVRRVAARQGPVGAGNERALHQRILDELRAAGAWTKHEGYLAKHGQWWTRRPGGIDVVAASADGQHPIAVECKIGKLEEVLWDAIKVAQAVTPGAQWPLGVETAAVVVEAPRSALVDLTKAPILLDPRREFRPIELIQQRPADWLWAMQGGCGIRPTSLPARVSADPPIRMEYAHAPETMLVLRFYAAIGEARVALDEHGWPIGFDVDPAWRAKIDASDTPTAGPPPPPFVAPERRHPQDQSEVVIAPDHEGRAWAHVWYEAPAPTSYRLVDNEPDVYDRRISKNGADTSHDSPRSLPNWCQALIHAAIEGSRRP